MSILQLQSGGVKWIDFIERNGLSWLTRLASGLYVTSKIKLAPPANKLAAILQISKCSLLEWFRFLDNDGFAY